MLYEMMTFMNFLSYLLLCIKYMSLDAYSFLKKNSSQDALLDTPRLLNLWRFFQTGCLLATPRLLFLKDFFRSPHIFFSKIFKSRN